MRNETKGMLLGLLGVGAFGLTLPITKIVIPYLDPVFIGLGRAVLAAIVALVLLLVSRQPKPTMAQAKSLLVVALGVVVGFPVLSSWAMQYVPASHGGVVLGILPLATAVVGVVVADERPSTSFWWVSLIGSALVIAYALLQGGGSIHIADLALLGAVIAAAIGYGVGARLSVDMGGWQVICWALVFSLPFITVPTLMVMPASLSDIPASIYVGFLYLALVSQLSGFFLWYKGLAIGGIARVSQVQLLQPFITLLASVILLGEKVTLYTLLFILLVGASVWLGKKMPVKRHK